MRFDNFLDCKNDEIDNTAYYLLCLLASKDVDVPEDDETVEWDMEIIGEVVDYAEELLRERNIEVCRPFFEGEDETPCYLGKDCKRKDCVFRRKSA